MLNSYFLKFNTYLKDRKYFTMALVCVFGLLLFLFLRSHRHKAEVKKQIIVPAVKTKEIKKTTLYKEIRLVGKTVPLAKIDIVAKTGGVVKKVAVELGDTVKEGQLLLLQDQDYAQAELDRYKAYYEESKATARKTSAEYANDYKRYKADYQIAKSNYERYEKLFSQGAVSRYELDAMEQKLNSARGAYQELEEQQGYAGSSSATVYAKEQTAMRRLGDYRMRLAKLKDLEFYAPRAGVISYRHAEVGSYVGAGTKLLTITDNSSLYVDCSLPEYDAALLQEGQKVEIELESQGLKLPASLIYVSPDQFGESKSFFARLKLEKDSSSIKAGLLARAVLKIKQKEAAIVVPKDVVLERNGKYYVFCLDKANRVDQRTIKIGLKNDQELEILQGLKEGDKLIISNLSRLKKGMSVNLATGEKE